MTETLDFPEEDAAEDALKAAEVYYNDAQSKLAHEKTVFAILDGAAAYANRAQAALQSV